MTKKSQYRALAPASSATSPASNPEQKDSSSSSKGQPSMSTVLPKKRSPVPLACKNCQKRKSKCSGQRPACSSCVERGFECHYDVKDSAQALRNTIQELNGKLNEYERAFGLIGASSDVNEIRRILESLSTSLHGVKSEGSLDESVEQGKSDNPSMILSPSSSADSTVSAESQDFITRWQRSGSMQDIIGFQESSGEAHIELFGNLALTSPSLFTVTADRMRVQIPEHLVQPLWNSEKSHLGQAYVGFRDAALKMIAGGTPAEQILGPDFVSVDLFFRKREPTDGYTVASWACEMVKSFEMIEIHARLGLAVLFTYLMRWMLNPTLETYQRVPGIIRPTPSQRLIPHAPTIDLAITPPVREALCRKARDWTAVMEKYIRFEWPYSIDDCFEYDETTGRDTKLTAQFVRFASDVTRWSFQRSILNELPEVAGQVAFFDSM